METRVQDSHQQLEPSDEALVERVRRKDVTAFSLLYDRYARPIYILAVTALDQAEAEEIVQEVFLFGMCCAAFIESQVWQPRLSIDY